mmetsp:Transcript_36107/g.75892  ORF Transcript_36107/g.75892 Transcript_36107/m.75892 type:complete len:232 (-) Transcript_36107:794-1489(-)
MPHNERKTRMIIGSNLPSILPLPFQRIKFIQKGLNMIREFRRRERIVLLVDGLLRRVISTRVRLIELLLRRHIVILSQGHVKQDVPYLFRQVSGILVEEHSIVSTTEILHFFAHVRRQQFAKGRRCRFVEESVTCEERGGIGRIAVTHSQRRVGRHVVGRLGVAVSALVVGECNLRFVSVVVKHIGHGSDAEVSGSVVRFEPSRVDHLIRPLPEFYISFDIVAEKGYGTFH